jgi:cytochrome c553
VPGNDSSYEEASHSGFVIAWTCIMRHSIRLRPAPQASLGAFLTAVLWVLASPAAPAADAEDARRELLEAARLTPDPANGKALFETCAACHQPDGLGTSDGSVPAIAGQHGSVLLKQLTDFRHDRRWDERMQHFSDRHHLPTAQDLTDVAAYASKLPRFGARADAVGSGAYLKQGASVYFRVCEACHAPLGQGDVLRFRPRLAGQHYVYLLKQLTDTALGQRPGMDAEHVTRIRALSDDEKRGVADYLSRLSPDLTSQGVLRVRR